MDRETGSEVCAQLLAIFAVPQRPDSDQATLLRTAEHTEVAASLSTPMQVLDYWLCLSLTGDQDKTLIICPVVRLTFENSTEVSVALPCPS